MNGKLGDTQSAMEAVDQSSLADAQGQLDDFGASAQDAGAGGLAAQAGAEEAYASVGNLGVVSDETASQLEALSGAGSAADSGLAGAASSADDASGGFGGAASGAGELGSALGGLDSDLGPVVGGISGMGGALDDLVNSGSLDDAAGGILGIAAAGITAVGALGVLGGNFENTAMQFEDATQASAEETAFWSNMLADVHSSLGAAQLGVTMLTNKVQTYALAAQSGKTDSSAFATTMAHLGVTMLDTNGNALPTIDIFDQIMTKLVGLHDNTLAADYISTIFSRGLRTSLMPVVQNYSDLLPTVNQQTADTAAEFDNANQKATSYDIATHNLGISVDHLAVSTLPLLTDALDLLNIPMGGWADIVAGLEWSIPDLGGKIEDLLGHVGDLGDALGKIPGVSKLEDLFGGGGGGEKETVPGGPKLKYASGGMTPYSGLFEVGEAGPETVALPGGSRVYSNAESKDMGGHHLTIYGGTINIRPQTLSTRDIWAELEARG
ncbi:MAG: hypothetical protein ABSG55_00810 [Dehalococcoidia bacterium]